MKIRAQWVDNLRSFIIILVVAHHAALSYMTTAHFNKEAYILSSHPIVDTQRWIGMDRFVYFNDIFFMSLMFFISGLFVIKSIGYKGERTFLRDRFDRLLIPFFVAVVFLMPLAHYPAYRVSHDKGDIIDFIVDFFTTEYWPVGPPWFIWVLFMFNGLMVWFFKPFKSLLDKISKGILYLKNKPIFLFFAWYALTWVLYVPMRLLLGAYGWTGIGPFDFQKCTLLLYFGYFLLGAAFGNMPEDQGMFSDAFLFIKKWKIWLVLCFSVYLLLILIDNPLIGNPLKQLVESGILNNAAAALLYCSVYAASCTLSCIAFPATFKALVNYSDRFWNAMAPHSFFIYLVHYIFIIWAQYYLLQTPIHAFLKFIMVFLIAISMSWFLSYLAHKNAVIRQYV